MLGATSKKKEENTICEMLAIMLNQEKTVSQAHDVCPSNGQGRRSLSGNEKEECY